LLVTLHARVGDLRTALAELRTALAAKEAENAELRRALLGPRSERQPRRQASGPKQPPLSEAEKAKRQVAAQEKRAANRTKRKEKLESVRVPHSAPEVCPKCSGTGPFTPLGPELAQEIAYVEERLLRIIHALDKKLCPCGHIFSATAPARVTEGWLKQHQPQHDPKSPLGRRIGYPLNQWSRLIRFLDDPKLRLDNNLRGARVAEPEPCASSRSAGITSGG
jgi:hypothetical protein